jgi:hypothetical protein
MTDLTTTTPAAVEPSPAPAPLPGAILPAASALIRATAQSLDDAYRIGNALANTTFAPTAFRGKADDATAAILYGAQVGLDPLTALQSVFVIGGKPAMYARTMAAVVMAAGHDVWTEDESDEGVTVAGRRKGWAPDRVERIRYTMADAERAGYTSNAQYRKNPRAMLYARALGDVCRRIAPDALLGLAYTAEEMQGAAQQDTAVERVTVQQADAWQQPAPAPAQIEQHDPTTARLTMEQRRTMRDLMEQTGLNKASMLALATEVAGREVPNADALTEAEAAQVIAALQGELDAQAQQPAAPADAGAVDAAPEPGPAAEGGEGEAA